MSIIGQSITLHHKVCIVSKEGCDVIIKAVRKNKFPFVRLYGKCHMCNEKATIDISQEYYDDICEDF